MAVFLSRQMTPPVAPVSGPSGPGRGIHVARGEYTLTGVMSINDTLRVMVLHVNFRVTGGWVKTSALGAGVLVQVGDAADDDRYFTATSAATAGTITSLAETGRGYKTTAMTPVILKITGANTANNGTITVELHGNIEQPD